MAIGTKGSGVYAGSVQQTSDGGYIIAGQAYGNATTVWDILLLKYDSEGMLEWAKIAGDSDWEHAHSVLETSDGGFIVTGETTMHMRNRIILYKFDGSGEIEWARKLNGFGQGRSVQQTDDGGYLVTGSTRYFTGGQSDQMVLLKFSSSGELEWSRTGSGLSGFSVQTTADGGSIVIGTAGSDLRLLRFDSTGVLQWARRTGGPGSEWGYSVQETLDGGFIAAGSTNSYGAGYYDVLLAKYDSSGSLEWAKTTGYVGETCTARSVRQTIDGGYIVAGNRGSYDSDIDILLLKYDSAGTLQWARTIGTVDYSDGARSVRQTVDGGYVLLGARRSYAGVRHEILFMKTGADGAIPSCDTISPTSPVAMTVYLNNRVASITGNSSPIPGSWPSVSTRIISPYVQTICSVSLPAEERIDIDIRPGSHRNPINLCSKGAIPVAILGNATFDVASVNPSTVVFAGAQPLRWAFEDVDIDGDIDMILHFKIQETDIKAGDTEATLEATLMSGAPIAGYDSLEIIGKCGSVPSP